MCRNIVTRSIHCTDSSHAHHQRVVCEKAATKIARSQKPDPWTEAVKCGRKNKKLFNFLAEECQFCQDTQLDPMLTPWWGSVSDSPENQSIEIFDEEADTPEQNSDEDVPEDAEEKDSAR